MPLESKNKFEVLGGPLGEKVTVSVPLSAKVGDDLM